MPVKCGLLPRQESTRQRYAATCAYAHFASAPKTVMQRISWVRNQLQKPSCVGHAFAAGIDGALGRPPWASAVELWRDARRRQGNLEGILDGTRAEYVIESIVRRGWSPFQPGEDSRSSRDDDNPKGKLSDELFAYDKRQTRALHYSITKDRVAAVIDALSKGFVVCGGWGLQDKFMAPPARKMLDASYFGGLSGHEMRIVGYDAEQNGFLVQNSWGPFWSSARFNGIVEEGCCLIGEDALLAAWDIDVIEVTP